VTQLGQQNGNLNLEPSCEDQKCPIFLQSHTSIPANLDSSDLYYKVGGGDETGLGLVGESDHEIEAGQSIVLNLGGLFSKDVTSLTLMLGSIQEGELGHVCDAYADCITFNSSVDFKPVSIMSLYSDMIAHDNGQLTVTAGPGDVLIDQLQATTCTVPEPSSLLLMGSGVLAMAGVVRRKLRL
jgi:hypothetical protein